MARYSSFPASNLSFSASGRSVGACLREAITSRSAHPVAVISDPYWRWHLSASENAVGSRLTINGTVFTVIGIAEPQFFGTTLTVRSPDVWIPLVMQPVVRYFQNASSHDGADPRKPWPPQETIEWLSVFVRVPRATDPSALRPL